jgi:hypothetical protein
MLLAMLPAAAPILRARSTVNSTPSLPRIPEEPNNDIFKSDFETAAAHDKPFSDLRFARRWALMLAPTLIFRVDDLSLARSPEHASRLARMAKDIKRMKYWMRLNIG